MAAMAPMLASAPLQADGVAWPRAEVRGFSPCARVVVLEASCAAAPSDPRAELLARLAQAILALERRDERAAIAQFRALATFYRRGGDQASAAEAELHAARLLVSIGRFDEALAMLAALDDGAAGDARGAAREHLRVVALERKGEVRAARARLLAAMRAYKPALWDGDLAADAERLGVATAGPISPRALAGLILAAEWIGLFAFAAVAWLRASPAERRGFGQS